MGPPRLWANDPATPEDLEIWRRLMKVLSLVDPERSVLRTQASQNAQNAARTQPNKKGQNRPEKKRAGGFGGAAAPPI